MAKPETCGFCKNHHYFFCIYEVDRKRVTGREKAEFRVLAPSSGPIDFASAKQIREATQEALRRLEAEARSRNCPNVELKH